VQQLTWICSLVPAVMLEMVQHASFLMLFLCVVVRRSCRQPNAPQLITTDVWKSLPVTMLPTVRRAGTKTAAEVLLDAAYKTQLHGLPSCVVFTCTVLTFIAPILANQLLCCMRVRASYMMVFYYSDPTRSRRARDSTPGGLVVVWWCAQYCQMIATNECEVDEVYWCIETLNTALVAQGLGVSLRQELNQAPADT
jgi:hypothetical protein